MSRGAKPERRKRLAHPGRSMRRCRILEQDRLACTSFGNVKLFLSCREIEMKMPEHIHADNHVGAEAVAFVIDMLRPAAKCGPVVAAAGQQWLDDDDGVGDGDPVKGKRGEAARISLRVGVV